MPKILLIEDAPEFQRMVTAVFNGTAKVVVCSNLADARKTLQVNSFDLILLDVTLPDGNGFEFCNTIRVSEATREVPVIFLTAKSELENRLMGFRIGADDYVVKPFNPLELRARVEARLKRRAAGQETTEIIRKGGLVIHLGSQQVTIRVDQREIELDLTPIEFKLLHFLVKNDGQTYTRQDLIQKVWGGDVHVLTRTVDTHMSKLRRKLTGSGFTITSVHGVGYRFTTSTRKSQQKAA